LKPGKAETIQEFPDAAFTLLAYGSMVGEAYLLNEILNIPFNLVNLRFAKPLDEETILEMARHGKPVVTLEEHSLIGGVGEMINSLLMKNRIPAPILNIGLEDRFYPHGKREKLLEIAGLKSEQLAEKINIFLKMQD
jgi:1-deoxy-D-xylulose-5-phosphate synthase